LARAQILYLDVPDRAAVDLAVTQADSDPRNRRFAGLVNALLRRMVREKEACLLPEIARHDTGFSGLVRKPASFRLCGRRCCQFSNDSL
jgi:16S rRNA C967 or C1407 C5-methylase (RsmB/RsmF family)